MPVSRGRKLDPTELNPQQKDLYDTIVGGPRAGQRGSVPLVDADGRLEGPFNAFLLQPALGQALQTLGATLRYESALAGTAREVAILVVAAARDAEFERFAHEPVARSLGLTGEQLSGIRTGNYGALDAHDALVARATREMLDHGDLSDSTFLELDEALGPAQVFELTALVGYYSLLALQLRVFRVAMPGHAAPGPHEARPNG
jgi:4-carboxymuconolactone decarboxylase